MLWKLLQQVLCWLQLHGAAKFSHSACAQARVAWL